MIRQIVLLFFLLVFFPNPEVVAQLEIKKSKVLNSKLVELKNLPESQIDYESLREQYKKGIFKKNEFNIPIRPIAEGKVRESSRVPELSKIESDVRPTDLRFVKSTDIKSRDFNDLGLVIAEPSVARSKNGTVLVAGNVFATMSTDDGDSFEFLSPFDVFGPSAYKTQIAGDQVVQYDEERDLMIWYVQYAATAAPPVGFFPGVGQNENSVKIAVAQGQDIAEKNWKVYEISPRSVSNGQWTNLWFDFPDLALSEEHLYITTNMFGVDSDSANSSPENQHSGVIIQMSLDELSQQVDTPSTRSIRTRQMNLRPTQSSKGEMYFGSHWDAQTLHVIKWDENSGEVGTLTEHLIDIEPWRRGQPNTPTRRVSRTPTNANWLARMDDRMTGAWDDGNYVGFAWCAREDQNFDSPHIRVAIIDKDKFTRGANNLEADFQPHVGEQGVAFAYPSMAVNQSGTVGIAFAYGGGGNHPSHAVGVLNKDRRSWLLRKRRAGSQSVGPTHATPFSLDTTPWGDYLTIRPVGRSGFVSCGFTVEGPNASGIELCYTQFATDIVSEPQPTDPTTISVNKEELETILERIQKIESNLESLIENGTDGTEDHEDERGPSKSSPGTSHNFGTMHELDSTSAGIATAGDADSSELKPKVLNDSLKRFRERLNREVSDGNLSKELADELWESLHLEPKTSRSDAQKQE